MLPLAQTGNVEAQVFVGVMYHIGQGVKKDTDQARRWLLRAAKGTSLNEATDEKPLELEFEGADPLSADAVAKKRRDANK